MIRIICFQIELVLCDLYLMKFDLTKGLLFNTFFIAIFYELCRYDYWVLEFEWFQ